MLLLLGYLAILFFFGQSTYGQLDNSRVIYSRGTGQLFFSAVVWGLWSLALVISIWGAFSRKVMHPTNMALPAIGLLVLFTGHMAVGLVQEVPVEKLLGGTGLINFMHLLVIAFVVLKLPQDKRDLDLLTTFMVLALAARGVFGLVRLAAFGGDPSNVYSNVEHIAVKISFFDICDSLLASVVFYYCLRRLAAGWKQLSNPQRLGLMAIAAIELAVIILSYRRTAWAGLLLVCVWLVLTAPPKTRQLAWLGLPAILAGVAMVARNRLERAAAGRGIFETFFYDLVSKGTFERESSRVVELKLAFLTFLDNPVFGVGMWGKFQSGALIGWQTGTDAFNFVHSGVLHILFKTGLVGFTLFAITVGLFMQFLATKRRLVPVSDRILFDACIAGFLFMLPDFLIGTPIPQIRTMMLYGFLLALPYVIVGVAQQPVSPVTA